MSVSLSMPMSVHLPIYVKDTVRRVGDKGALITSFCRKQVLSRHVSESAVRLCVLNVHFMTMS